MLKWFKGGRATLGCVTLVLSACGAAPKAEPTEVEIAWPDAATFFAPVTDAGVAVVEPSSTAPVDAAP